MGRLPELLKRVASSADLSPLTAEFGAQPCWVEIPPAPGCARLAVAGHAADFTWLAAEAEGPPPVAVRRLARRLASEGRAAGVLGFYPEARRLAIAAGDRHLVVALDQPAPVHVACLARLADTPADLWYPDRVQAALSGSEAGAAFFRDFRQAVDRFAAALPGGMAPDDRRTLALVQLTRMLFLYFVESKGWLDGHPAFLREQLDQCLARGRNVHRHLIQPLFFGALNRPARARADSVRAFGRIPFLNGGLFEPHPLEQAHRVALPNAVWRDALDQLFERYHFTVHESQDDAASIAPDMLGRVFEGIMAPDTRKSSGTYYTPAALVRRLVDAGLAAALAAGAGLSDEEASARLDARDPAMMRRALAMRVLDPACGSGAFLLGALERLAALRSLGGDAPAAARRAVLARNLYGVDLDPMAVRLAELRLWLAVVAEERDVTPETVRPLPNLDCLIRQGDALLEPPELGLPPSPLASRLRVVRETLVHASGDAKRAATRDLRRLELEAAVASLVMAEQRVTRRIHDLLDAARAPALFETPGRLTREHRADLRQLRRELHRLRGSRRRAVREGQLPWFSFASQFADVIADGGFDLVIGNPPWVRAETLAPARRAMLIRRYRSWRGGGTAGYRHQPDLAVAFLERAIELSAPAGALALVLPSKVATAGYGWGIRGLLTDRATVHAVVPLDRAEEARFAATVYPMALIATRRQPPPGRLVRSTLEPAPGGTPLSFYGEGPWIMRGGRAPAVVEALATSHPLFGQVYRCRLGVKTGADRVFIDPTDVEAPLLRPLLRGRDVRAFHASPQHTLLWTCDDDGVPLTDLPPRASEWIASHRRQLLARRDYQDGPAWQLFRTRGATERFRVVWPDLSRQLVAAPLLGPLRRAIPLNSCYVGSMPDRDELLAVTGWLNAPLVRAIARAGTTEASGGFRRFNATVVGRIPFPLAARAHPALVELATAAVRGAPSYPDLDAIVADLLGVDHRDRRALHALA
ncbi:MAG TPA: N-6 DNA methylase [Gemmatimonadales bacterium]|nr:N-6 DNA methylase [Gemmatimonadales bacterium]